MFQQSATSAPLAGIRVLDLGRYQAAPRCALELGRLGADVIKVEPIDGDESREPGPFKDGVSIGWALLNAGKRSLALDLRSDAGREVLLQLVKLSDVLVHNFRPGVMAAMGLEYAVLRAANRRLILVNISGFGRADPRPAFDPVFQAISGLMSLNGDPAGGPTLAPLPIVDRLTALNATIAVLAALLRTSQTGDGQEIDITLADAARSAVELPMAVYLGTGEAPERSGNATGLGNAFACRDGLIYIGDFGSDRIFGRLAKLLGQPGWPGAPEFATRASRAEHSGLIEASIINWCEPLDVATAIASLEAAEIPCARVNDIPSASREPSLVGGSLADQGAAPAIGQHTDEILAGPLKLSRGDIASLRAAMIVR